MKKKINSLQEAVRKNIYFINHGGCIHFVYFLSKRLRELGIYHRVCFSNCCNVSLDYDKFEAVNHVTIYIPRIGYIDGYETTKKLYRKYNTETEKISLNKLNRFRKEYDWNPTYDIGQNRKLNSLIKKYIY